ncbi:MAG: DNA repair protein RecO [Pseudoclavibacter sp.]|nr:DNA repair protein RecO [Pseudoclavibacter sp.]
MPSYRDEAIVLRTQQLGEADRIVTLLGRERGLIRAAARGVRRTSSRFGARLEPFMAVDGQFHAGRSLDTVTQAATIASHGARIVADFDAYAAASVMTEAAERLAQTDSPRQLYVLLLGGLRALARREHPPRLVLDAYLLRALAVAGWAASFGDCARCGRPGPHERLSVPLGGSVCGACGPKARPVPPELPRHLGALLTGEWAAAEAGPEHVRRRGSAFTSAYARYHLDRDLRSLQLLDRPHLEEAPIVEPRA